jgi:hypothetical protein
MAGGASEHVEKIRKSNFNRQRDGDVLRDNCGGEGYVFSMPGLNGTVAAGRSEFHHVLPVTSLQDGNILDGEEDEVMAFIHKCMAKTTWDTNTQPNLLGLPTKQPYYDADLKAAGGMTLGGIVALNPQVGDFGSLPDLPCHKNDHDKYTTAVIDKLNETLWPNLIEDVDVCKDPGKSIRSLLQTQSKNWKAWLKARGQGAADSWVNREQRPQWYYPLSMAPDPTPSDPPPNVSKRKKLTVDAWLEKIFSWAG